MSSIPPPNQTNINITATTSQAKVISLNKDKARVMFGGKTWDITVTDKGQKTPIDLSTAQELVNKITDVFQSLVDSGAIDPSKHQTAEIQTSNEENFASTVFVTEKGASSQQKQNINDTAKTSLQEFGKYLQKNNFSKFSTPSPPNPQQIRDLSFE